MLALFFISLAVLLFLSVPIASSLSLATIVGVWFHDTLPLEIIPQRIFIAMNSFPLMAIPFFILAGNLMTAGGLSQRLVNFASALVGHRTGGLAMVAIITSMFFAAISGSGAATTAAIGSILIPAMVARGYHIEYAASNQAISGALGVIIPPSIPMILYGVAAEVSIGDMFLAGILPGLLITVSLLISAYIISKRRGYHGVERQSIRDVGKAFKEAILALLMPVIVLGGIYTGIFTPTEASVIAVVYSFVIGFLVYREISVQKLVETLRDSAIASSVIMIVIGAAGLFGFFINITGVPDMVYGFISELVTNKYVFLIMMNVLLLLAGMFLDGGAAILIFVPLLLSTAVNLGIDPVHFGTIMVVNLAIGLVTPPVGIDLFVVSQLSKLSIGRVAKAAVPLIILLFVDVLIISFVPELSTWIPSLVKD
ncbi:TRAP transporter large permease [Brevibacillus humidisoli]|uniref:TRAP transporter large permease n=1 Tax=Brevibacillus humidisoli TaxID=2895522 RepID=UPI001E4C6E64|nr:TRAP transporter large permease [Brevibacillus humidisoli]UFJ39914.1 TRAP transporter large permease [Brevibacillus humidisoli]